MENAYADALSRRPDHFGNNTETSLLLFQLQADGALRHPIQATADDEEYRAVFREQRLNRDISVLVDNPDEQVRLARDVYKSRLGGHIGITKTVA